MTVQFLTCRTPHENDKKTSCFSDLLTRRSFLIRYGEGYYFLMYYFLKYAEGVPFVNGKYTKGLSFLPKMVYKR